MAKANARTFSVLAFVTIGMLCLVATGCRCYGPREPGPLDVPTELNKVAHPEYTIAPPDVLLLDAANLIPRPPYRISPLDGLFIRVLVYSPKEKDPGDALLPGQPINGIYRVEVDGTVNLGFDYGSVPVAGKTVPEAKDAVKSFLKQRFKIEFEVNVALSESRAIQQIRGEHLVRQDGKVTLGTYGSVFVAGMTVDEARHAIEKHLSQKLLDPEISVDVAGFNSKVYYVIIDLAGTGQTISRSPITGNETVLDAISQSGGLPGNIDRKRIWVARRSPADHPCNQILPVDWDSIVCGGSTATNYQLLPGDRVYVSADRCVALANYLDKVLSPFERVLGVTLLGSSVVHSVPVSISSNSNNSLGPALNVTGTGTTSTVTGR